MVVGIGDLRGLGAGQGLEAARQKVRRQRQVVGPGDVAAAARAQVAGVADLGEVDLIAGRIGAAGRRETAEHVRVARYFEAWLLRLGGSYPRRKTCPACGRLLADEGASYLASEHRIECRRCLSAGVSLSPATVRYLETIWKEPPETLEPPQQASVLRELGVFHYRMIQEQLEKDLKSHQVLEDMLRQG